MGIIGEFVEKTAASIAFRSSEPSLDELEAKAIKKRKKDFECAPGEKVLLINKEQYTMRDEYNIYDENNHIVYSIKGKLFSAKPQLRIYDAHRRELGVVKEKCVSLRLSALREVHPVDFVFLIQGRIVGKLRSTRSKSVKRHYLLDNGWTVEENLMGLKQKIFCGDQLVATISQKLLTLGDTYLVKFRQGENELLILMIVLSMIALDIDAIKKASKPSRFYGYEE